VGKRTVSVEGDSDLLELGVPPWGSSLEPLTGYVGGRFDDGSPLTPLLWSDLRRAYRRNGIRHREAVMFEMHMAGVSIRRIAEAFGFSSASSAQYWCNRVRSALEGDPELGLITTIVEDCGGWGTVAEYLF